MNTPVTIPDIYKKEENSILLDCKETSMTNS